jgi:hypothetical protein
MLCLKDSQYENPSRATKIKETKEALNHNKKRKRY